MPLRLKTIKELLLLLLLPLGFKMTHLQVLDTLHAHAHAPRPRSTPTPTLHDLDLMVGALRPASLERSAQADRLQASANVRYFGQSWELSRG